MFYGENGRNLAKLMEISREAGEFMQKYRPKWQFDRKIVQKCVK